MVFLHLYIVSQKGLGKCMERKVFIVAEISANHGNDINIVKKTMLKAKEIGADAVKIQTYTPETLTLDCDNDYFKISSGTLWDGMTLFKLYNEAFTPWEWHKELFDFAKKEDILLFSTPFDNSAIDLLEECNNPFYKIASFEILDLPLIRYAASKMKPMIISTGIASLEDIEDAIFACREVGNNNITLLQCTSAYPAKISDSNILTMVNMKERFNVKVGLSDHTTGNIASIVAATLGAEIIERHFIINREIGGPDAKFSLDINEFSDFVKSVRDAECALGKIDYSITAEKNKNRKFGRSLFAIKDINKGEEFSVLNIKSIRPGDGVKPKYLPDLIGKKAKRNIKFGTPILMEDLEKGRD